MAVLNSYNVSLEIPALNSYNVSLKFPAHLYLLADGSVFPGKHKEGAVSRGTEIRVFQTAASPKFNL